MPVKHLRVSNETKGQSPSVQMDFLPSIRSYKRSEEMSRIQILQGITEKFLTKKPFTTKSWCLVKFPAFPREWVPLLVKSSLYIQKLSWITTSAIWIHCRLYSNLIKMFICGGGGVWFCFFGAYEIIFNCITG